MGNSCQICNHPNRLEIDREIVQGKSIAGIARKYSLGWDSVDYHAKNHLSRQLVKSYAMREALQSQGLVTEIEELLGRSKSILAQAEQDGRLNLALNAIRETRGTLELMAKIAATLHQIRAQELQQAQVEADDRREVIEDEALARLSNDELGLYLHLMEKMYGVTDEDTAETIDQPVQHLPQPKRSRRTRHPKPEAVEEWDEAMEAQALAEEQAMEEPEPTPIKNAPPPPRQEPEPAGTWGERLNPFPGRVLPGSIRTTSPELARFLDLD